MLDIRHFEIVQAIHGAGTVTGAARRLHLTQPAVSHALAELERRLGVSLFVREPRGMTLTREGRRVLDAAEIVLPVVREAEHDLSLFREGCQGVVRVSTQCYTAYHWLPQVLRHFSGRFPDVDVRIVPDAAGDPLTALLEDRLDVAVTHTEPTDGRLVSEGLFDDEIVAVVPATDPLAARARLEPADFEGRDVLLHSDAASSALFTDFLAPAGVRPGRVSELQLTQAVLQATRAGLGITAVTRWVVESELEGGDLVAIRLGAEGVFRRWRLVTRRDLRGRASVQELARLLVAEGAMHASHEERS